MTTSDVNTDALRRSHGDKYDALRECNETRASVLLSKLLIFGSFFPFLIVFCCIGDCCILRPNNFNPTLLRAAKDYSYWPEVFPRLPLAEKRIRLVGVSVNFFCLCLSSSCTIRGDGLCKACSISSRSQLSTVLGLFLSSDLSTCH